MNKNFQAWADVFFGSTGCRLDELDRIRLNAAFEAGWLACRKQIAVQIEPVLWEAGVEIWGNRDQKKEGSA